jgi:uncharacterized protein (TIGR03067 family)
MRALLMIPLLMLAVPDRQDPTPREAKSLTEQFQGKWQKVKWVAFGKEDMQTFSEDVFTIIDASHWTNMERGESTGDEFIYTIDLTKHPAAFSMVYKDKNVEKKLGVVRINGIFKIEGDILTYCATINGAAPTEFISTSENGMVLTQMRRYQK